MSTPVDHTPSFRDSFEELFPCSSSTVRNSPPEARRCSLLVDCSGSTHNLFVETELGYITIFDLLGSFATRVAAETTGMEFVPFASTFKKYPVKTEEQVQELFSHATEQGLFNHLGEGTNIYDPLEKLFDEFLDKATKAASLGKNKLKTCIVVATDGVPTGGAEALKSVHELCSKAFAEMEKLGYTDKDFSLSIVTVRPDAISDAWHDERGQTVEQWQKDSDGAVAFYASLGERLRADERIRFDFVSQCTLAELAQQGVRDYLSER